MRNFSHTYEGFARPGPRWSEPDPDQNWSERGPVRSGPGPLREPAWRRWCPLHRAKVDCGREVALRRAFSSIELVPTVASCLIRRLLAARAPSESFSRVADAWLNFRGAVPRALRGITMATASVGGHQLGASAACCFMPRTSLLDMHVHSVVGTAQEPGGSRAIALTVTILLHLDNRRSFGFGVSARRRPARRTRWPSAGPRVRSSYPGVTTHSLSISDPKVPSFSYGPRWPCDTWPDHFGPPCEAAAGADPTPLRTSPVSDQF